MGDTKKAAANGAAKKPAAAATPPAVNGKAAAPVANGQPAAAAATTKFNDKYDATDPVENPSDDGYYLLRVIGTDGNEIHYRIKSGVHLEKLMKSYAERTNVRLDSLRFTHDGKAITVTNLPSDLDVQKDNRIMASPLGPQSAQEKKEEPEKERPQFLKLQLRSHETDGSEVHFKVNYTTTMGKVFKCYAERRNIDQSLLIVYFMNRLVKDDDTPEKLDVLDEDYFEAYVWLDKGPPPETVEYFRDPRLRPPHTASFFDSAKLAAEVAARAAEDAKSATAAAQSRAVNKLWPCLKPGLVPNFTNPATKAAAQKQMDEHLAAEAAAAGKNTPAPAPAPAARTKAPALTPASAAKSPAQATATKALAACPPANKTAVPPANKPAPATVSPTKAADPQSDGYLNIVVLSNDNHEVQFRVKSTVHFEKVRKSFADRIGYAAEYIRLFYRGARIHDDDSPQLLQMKEGDMLQAESLVPDVFPGVPREPLAEAMRRRKERLKNEAKKMLAKAPPTVYLPVRTATSGGEKGDNGMEQPALTVYQRLELIADRLAALFNGDRAVHDHVPAAHQLFQSFLAQTDYAFINAQKGPILEHMMHAGTLIADRANEDREDREAMEAGEEVDSPGPYPLPSDEFFAGVGWLAFAHQDDLSDYGVLQSYLESMVGEKAFREHCPPLYFSMCITLLEKLNHALDPPCTTEDYLQVLDASLDAVYFYLYERTDVAPSQMLMDNALRIMRSIAPHGDRKPKFWPMYLRIFVTRCLRTRELPFVIQQTCYKLVCQAAWIVGPRFWTSDEQFVRTLAAMCAVHWRLMLEGLAEREPLVAAYTLFLEIFLVCEERHRISDQTAICVASNCKEMLESVAGYIKGQDQNPKPLMADEIYIVCALLSTLVSTGAFQMIHDDDESVIVDWWLTHSVDNSDVFRQLMLCCTFIKKLDGRVVTSLAAYYERALLGVAEDSMRRLLGQQTTPTEPDLMVMHWVMKLVQEKRTDFYDKASLSDAVARLERVRTPKKYLDQLKNLKC